MTTEQRSRRQRTARGALGGATRSAVGAFAVALMVELGLVPADVGPHMLILLTWLAGQVLYTALSPRQWANLLGK